jgi:hypothetical protein
MSDEVQLNTCGGEAGDSCGSDASLAQHPLSQWAFPFLSAFSATSSQSSICFGAPAPSLGLPAASPCGKPQPMRDQDVSQANFNDVRSNSFVANRWAFRLCPCKERLESTCDLSVPSDARNWESRRGACYTGVATTADTAVNREHVLRYARLFMPQGVQDYATYLPSLTISGQVTTSERVIDYWSTPDASRQIVLAYNSRDVAYAVCAILPISECA